MGGQSSSEMDALPAAFYQLVPSVFDERFKFSLTSNFFEFLWLDLTIVRQSRCFTNKALEQCLATIVISNCYTWMGKCCRNTCLSTPEKDSANNLRRSIRRSKRFSERQIHPPRNRYMIDLQDLVLHRGEEAYANFFAFKKANLQVDWSYMFAVLSRTNCGTTFTSGQSYWHQHIRFVVVERNSVTKDHCFCGS